jgi:hypothetical protein
MSSSRHPSLERSQLKQSMKIHRAASIRLTHILSVVHLQNLPEKNTTRERAQSPRLKELLKVLQREILPGSMIMIPTGTCRATHDVWWMTDVSKSNALLNHFSFCEYVERTRSKVEVVAAKESGMTWRMDP